MRTKRILEPQKVEYIEGMLSKEIYLEAYKIIGLRLERGCKDAILKSSCIQEDILYCKVRKFNETFGVDSDGFMFPPHKYIKDCTINWRLTALCLAAAMAETGDI